MRVWRIPFSTNVERVSLGAAFKRIAVEWVDVDPRDRSAVLDISGQELVPVLVEDDGRVTADSTRILRRLEELQPDPPLWPVGDRERAEAEIFLEWFNHVWKRAPNQIYLEEGKTAPGAARIDRLGSSLTASLDLFEGLLDDGCAFLLGDELSVADVAAFPFLKYAADRVPEDDDRFHEILRRRLPLDGHPAVATWIGRVDALPRA